MSKIDEVDFYLKDLESRFKYLDKKKYYLSYSGGKDSHFLYWFIKEYLHDHEIEIVSVNTYMEHKEIFERMKRYADRILVPKLKPFEIKEKYGSPCFSKIQDEYINRYQNGCRTPDKKFTPLHDLSETGCVGCPYGSWKGETKIELDLLPDNRRKFVIEYFKESYDVLGIDYKHKQEMLELGE